MWNLRSLTSEIVTDWQFIELNFGIPAFIYSLSFSWAFHDESFQTNHPFVVCWVSCRQAEMHHRLAWNRFYVIWSICSRHLWMSWLLEVFKLLLAIISNLALPIRSLQIDKRKTDRKWFWQAFERVILTLFSDWRVFKQSKAFEQVK